MCRMAQALFWISFFSNWAPCRDQVSSPPGWWAVFLVSVLQSGRLYMCSLYSVPTSKGSEANDEPAWTWTPNPHSCGLYSFSSHSPLRYESPLFLIPENFLFLALVWISYFFFGDILSIISTHLEWSRSGLHEVSLSQWLSYSRTGRSSLSFCQSANVTESTRFKGYRAE